MAIISEAQDHVVARTVATLPFPEGKAPPEILLALRGWLGMVDALTVHWLEHKHMRKERVLELLVDLFVAVLMSAGGVAARPARRAR
jgi:hypothetical protein